MIEWASNNWTPKSGFISMMDFFCVRLPPEFLTVSGPLTWWCASTLGTALLGSSLAGSTMDFCPNFEWYKCHKIRQMPLKNWKSPDFGHLFFFWFSNAFQILNPGQKVLILDAILWFFYRFPPLAWKSYLRGLLKDFFWGFNRSWWLFWMLSLDGGCQMLSNCSRMAVVLAHLCQCSCINFKPITREQVQGAFQGLEACRGAPLHVFGKLRSVFKIEIIILALLVKRNKKVFFSSRERPKLFSLF